MAGQATRGLMDLTGGNVRRRGGIDVTVHAQGDSVHGVAVTMSFKVTRMAGLTVRAGALADSITNQGSGGGIVTGLTA